MKWLSERRGIIDSYIPKNKKLPLAKLHTYDIIHKRKKFVHNNNEEREVKNMDFFKTLKKAEWLNLLLSLVFIIIGAILVKDPEGVLKTVSLIAGIVFLVLGFIKIIKYLKDKSNSNELYLDIVFGLIAIITGLIVIFCTSAIEAIFRIIIGVWIIFTGCTRFALVQSLKQANLKEWVISLILAIIMIGCGLYMIFTPGTVVAVLGGVMIAYAVINIVQSIMFMKNSKIIVVEKVD